MAAKGKVKEDTAQSKLFADDLDQRTGTSGGAGLGQSDALSRAQVEAATAPKYSLSEKVSMGVSNAGAAAESMGAMIAKKVAEAQEIAASQAATNGGNMSVNLNIDGETIAKVSAKAGKNSKARTFSQVDPRDDDE